MSRIGPLKTYHVGFDPEAQLPDQSGKVYLITGANTGIGFETALILVKKGAKVYLACRSQERAAKAIASIESACPAGGSGKALFLHLDLQDLSQVKQAADSFLAQESRLDVLVNNAGIMACPFALTVDGIESQFGTNHIGHFLLTTILLPLLSKASEPRIVNVSSYGHSFAKGISFDTINDPKARDTWTRYGESKLANILFTRELNKRYPNIYTNALHPGCVATELLRGPVETYGFLMKPFASFFNYFFALTPIQGAQATLYCAASPEIVEQGVKGSYFYPYGKNVGDEGLSQYARDDELAQTLWQFSQDFVEKALKA